MASLSADFSNALEDEGSVDSQGILTPVDTADSTPESARSRRSARKKLCNFSSDFEYYSPGARKKAAEDELKVDSDVAPRGRPVGRGRKKGKQQPDVEEPIENEEENNQGQQKRIMRRKVAVKMQKKKVIEKEELGDIEEGSNLQVEEGIVKDAAKKTPVKGKKVGRKKKVNINVELRDALDGGSDKEEDNKQVKGQKRKKKGEAPKVTGKKAKTELQSYQEDEPSDEEAGQAPPYKATQRKMPKLKKQTGAPSPLAQNLMKKLAEVSSDSGSVSDLSPVSGPKRKLSLDGGENDVPVKTARNTKKNKQALAAAGLIRRIPASDQGMIKPTPVAKAASASASTVIEPGNHAAVSKKILGNKVSGNTALSSSSKVEVKTEEDSSMFSLDSDQTSEVAAGKSSTKEDLGVKAVEKIKRGGKIVKVEPKIEGNGKHGTKLQVIKKPDGTVIKKKVLPQGEQVTESEGKQKKVKVLKAESDEKVIVTKKFGTQGEKSKSTAVGILKKKQIERPVIGGRQNSKVMHTKVGGNGSTKSGSEGVSKNEANSQKIDNLLTRGIFHKRKSHLPFGNRKAIKVVARDVKTESAEVLEKDQARKKAVGQKVEEKAETKQPAGTERKKSSDGAKPEKGQSKKGAQRKSIEGTKKADKQLSHEESQDDPAPPVLIPATAMGKAKHKHHKVEHEVPLDLTMMDLFKPDGLVIHDPLKKDVGTQGGKLTATARKSQYSVDVYDPSSFVKPENIHHVLIEHQYSKSSPVILKQENESNTSATTSQGRDDDIESVSHKQTVIMDMNLPDQILEESEEPVVDTSIGDSHEISASASKGDLSLAKTTKDNGGRPSILECLDTELKEGGSEFRIVGQVEVGRVPAMAREESISTTQASDVKQADILTNKQNDSQKSGEGRKLSSDARKSSTEKRKNSSDKRDSSDKKDNTYARSDSQEGVKRKKKSKSSGPEDKKHAREGTQEGDADSEEHFEDDHNDLDWEPNDPNTLYCICRMPHNNRFMICCDKCEEWFHGTCVGVTKARGKEMEEKEEEYICPRCAKNPSGQPVEQQPFQSKPSDMASNKTKLLQKCIGQKCSKSPRPGSVYCSHECIMSHAQDSLKALREDQLRKKTIEKNASNESSKGASATSTSSPSASSSSLDTVEVFERQTGKVLKGAGAPTQKGLHRWLEQHPTYEVVQPHSRHRSRGSSKDDRSGDKEVRPHHEPKPVDREHRTSTDRDKKTDHSGRSRHSSSSSKDSGKKSDSERHGSSSHKSDHSSSTSRSEEKKDDGPNQIRINVRTALRDCLSARAQEAADIMLSSAEIKNLAVTIEEELFDLFNDTGHKYRTKYRSLVFNIKDQKNKGLFRKILTGKIKPHKLVQMSTEELASKELAKWREQATKHELEMIEKTEQEAMKESVTAKHVIKKTHKGEIEVEDEDLSILETRLEERKDTEPEPQEESSHAGATDTTDQHRAHLFDLNCKVCTGKIVLGPEEQAALAAAEKATVITLPKSQVEPAPESSEMDKIDYEKAEEIVKEALQTVQKMEQSVLSMSKIVSVSPKLEETPPLSPKLRTSRRESSASSASSTASSSTRKRVVVRSPDSALQAGLETKNKFTPTGPMLWKGFVSMLDVAKFFTSAYRVSGPTDHVVIPDTVHILGRISPEQMWDYLSKIRQAGSKDVTVIRFVPGSDDEKVAYVHLYSYFNSRSRCGVAGNLDKHIKDFYLVPLASHSKIPRALLPFDGPGLEENRPHMLLGILVRQRGKHGSETSDTSSVSSRKPANQGRTNTATKQVTPPVNRDPRLAKHSAKEGQPKVSPVESPSSSGSSAGEVRPKSFEGFEPEYIPSPIVSQGLFLPAPSTVIVDYVPTPTLKGKDTEDGKSEDKAGELTLLADESFDRDLQDEKESQHHKDHHHHHHHHREHHQHRHHHHHHHHKKPEKDDKLEDYSEPYSPGKEAEPYSPSQEAAADEPYDPGDENLMDDSEMPAEPSLDVSSSTSFSSVTAVAQEVAAAVVLTVLEASITSPELAETGTSVSNLPTVLQGENSCNISELVEQMARSNDPQEISALMVAALSAAKSSQEQQKLLVELTKKVEERKLQLAEAARQEAAVVRRRSTDDNEVLAFNRGSEDKAHSLGNNSSGLVDTEVVSSSSLCSFDASTAVSNSGQGSMSSMPTDVLNVPEQHSSSSSSSSSFLFGLVDSASHSSSLLPGLNSDCGDCSRSLLPELATTAASSSSSLPAAARQGTPPSVESRDAGGIKFSFTKSRIKPQHILSAPTAEVFSLETVEPKPKLPILLEERALQESVISDCSESDNTGVIPNVLKALMKDVMGISHCAASEKKLMMPLKTNTEKTKKAAKEMAKQGKEKATERQLLEAPAVTYKLLKDEAGEKTIESDLKNPKLSVSVDSSGAESAIVTSTSSGPGHDSGAVQSDTTSSIDQLLDKLKKGGFQFKHTDKSISALFPVSTSTQPLTPTDSQFSKTHAHPSYPVSKTSAPFSTSCTTSGQIIDPRQTHDSLSSQSLNSSLDFGAAAETSGPVHQKRTDFEDYDEHLPSAARKLESHILCPGSHAYTAVQKTSLDPLAFPQLPTDSYNYPPLPLPSTLPPLPPPSHGPLNPHFTQPPMEACTPVQPAQPHPTGIQHEAPGIVSNDFPHAGMDVRSISLPPCSPEQLPPPLPTQPSPSFAAVTDSQFPHPPPDDRDYRNKDSHNSHHGFPQHMRGDNRSFFRH